jgi:ferredoxin
MGVEMEFFMNNTEIYYFSGTGNSLAFARDLKEQINDCKLISIAKIWKSENIKAAAEKVGFVFPLYFFGLPKIIENFINKIDLSNSTYIFCIATSGGKAPIPDCIPNKMHKILKKKKKILNVYFRVQMPGNYIKEYNLKPMEIIRKRLESSKSIILPISKLINSNENKINKASMAFLAAIANDFWQNHVFKSDKKFYADSNCIVCGTCQKICPVQNIVLTNNKPVWNHHCQECMACIHFCPQKAIQSGERTIKRSRYHHPEVSLSDMLQQNE